METENEQQVTRALDDVGEALRRQPSVRNEVMRRITQQVATGGSSATTKPAGPTLAPAQMNIERAELDGDVSIDHPQLKMKSSASKSIWRVYDFIRTAGHGAPGLKFCPMPAMEPAPENSMVFIQ